MEALVTGVNVQSVAILILRSQHNRQEQEPVWVLH